MRNALDGENGVVSLEACITVTIFVFLMLFLYSFFVVFEVRNEMAHVTLSTANSMALDAFENETIGYSGSLSQILYNLYGAAVNDDSDFTDHRRWYENTVLVGSDGNSSINSTFESILRQRFFAYLTGGDAGNSESLLKRYHIVGGAEGLDFSESYVADNNLYLKVRYKVELEFNVFHLGEFEFEQSACSRLWK